MALVRKKKNGFEYGNYYLVIYVGGKQKWISTGTGNREKAAEFEKSYRQGEIPGRLSACEGMTVVDYAKCCLEEEAGSVRPSTRINNDYAVSCLQKYCDAAYGLPVPLVSVDKAFCKRYFVWLTENYSPTTAASRFGFLKAILARAELLGAIPCNPCERIGLENPSLQHLSRMATPLDAGKAGEFLGFCRAHMAGKVWPFWYAYYAWATAVYTGMRRGELLALTVSDVNLKERTLYVRHNLTLLESRQYGVKPVSPSGMRELYINASLDSVLDDLIRRLKPAEEEKRELVTRNNPRKHLFCGENYTPISPHSISMCIEEASDAWTEDGGCSLRFNDARHTCASILYNEQKLSLDTVSSFLGHKDVKTTERYLNKISETAVAKGVITATNHMASAIGFAARKSFVKTQKGIKKDPD